MGSECNRVMDTPVDSWQWTVCHQADRGWAGECHQGLWLDLLTLSPGVAVSHMLCDSALSPSQISAIFPFPVAICSHTHHHMTADDIRLTVSQRKRREKGEGRREEGRKEYIALPTVKRARTVRGRSAVSRVTLWTHPANKGTCFTPLPSPTPTPACQQCTNLMPVFAV